jgi:hypothetical protein
MDTTNANAMKTVGKDGYDITRKTGHAIIIAVQTGHHTLFRWCIIHEVALASLHKQSTNQLRMQTLSHLCYKKLETHLNNV